ncbi:MAG: conjugal transfer protein TraF [Nitrospira sp.]|nr:conjugal transfer protein TraF [Nitrospira sp.]
MKKTTCCIPCAAAFLAILLPLQAAAVEFVTVGSRQMGMGGAGVATTTDSLATYWNPAGMAMSKKFDIRFQGSGQVVDRGDVFDSLKDLNNLNLNDASAGNLARAQQLVDRINRPGTNLTAAASGGFYVKGNFGEHALGFSVSDVATAGGFLRSPVGFTNNGSNLTVNGQFAMNGLEARQAALSYAFAFMDRIFSIGVTGKIIQGAAYTGATNIRGASDDVSVFEDIGRAKISTALGIDVGAMFRPSSWLRMGIVAKDITAPTFDAPNGDTFKLLPQIRTGVAVNPYNSLTLTADVDLTKNNTLTPGLYSQVLSLGAEQTILSELLSFRIGAFKNMQDAKTPFIPTAGFGLRILDLRIDIAGGYDFRDQAALASGSVALTF